MSTRSRTRSATSVSMASSSTIMRPVSTRSRKNLKSAPDEESTIEEGRVTQTADSEEKENDVKNVQHHENDVNATGRNVKRKLTTNGKAKGKSKVPAKAYCTCRGQDDGTPMVLCSSCNDWYHFKCVQLSERDAEDIRIYVCPSCTEKTGYRTIMEWEGPDAVEEVKSDPNTKAATTRRNVSRTTANGANAEGSGSSVKNGTKTKKRAELEVSSSESDGGDDSEDDYISEGSRIGKKPAKLRRHLPSSDESDATLSDGTEGEPRRRRIQSRRTASPSLKRKRQTGHEPASKRKKSDDFESTAEDDPTRKYCLGKLEELFRKVFFRYPHIRVGDDELEEKKPEDLTDDDKSKLGEAAKAFATELEQCVYEIYSEPDKAGKPHAGAKYKDRFRMLQFNLGKDDRVVIHKRIVSSQITPKEISLMSSTDLANEETKQSIHKLEQEALEHSILQKATIPRAKITHKGLQDIEDENGALASSRERERERQQEEEERIERERLARLRAQRQRTQSVSVPPESPMSATGQASGNWGAPPPLPSHVSGDQIPVPASEPTITPSEPELNLADLINFDDDLQVATTEAIPAPATESLSPPPAEAKSTDTPPDTPAVATTGISPFSANPPKSETPDQQTSFDLNAVWSAPKPGAEETSTTPPGSPPAHLIPLNKDVMLEPEPNDNVAEDHDFDMFLDEPDPGTSKTPEALLNAFDSLPHVWSGKISMPLDSSIPQDTPVVARQIGGRTLTTDSLLWKTLFPADILRIEGRVPVDKSSEYLLQMRMNAGKELISVAFSSATEQDGAALQIITNFLIGKGRHGLIFPWGHRPKDYHPGRELYVIPLLSTDPLPDYIELLDELRLPKIRKANYLIGIWVLQKGKLAPPPTLPASQPIPSISTSVAAPAVNSPTLPQPPFASASPATLVAPQIEPAVLAAEVASLTPEQIQMMLRTLTSGTTIPIPPIASVVPPQVPVPTVPQATTPTAQPWPNPGYPPAHQQTGGPAINYQPSYGGYREHGNEQRPYGGEDNRRDFGDRGERGWRGRGRGRGKGRGGYGREDDGFARRPSDSGWPRQRGRGDHRGGGPRRGEQRA